MNAAEICYLSVGELSRLIRRKKLSPTEVMEAHLRRIEALEPTLNSFITLIADEAMKASRKAEREMRAGIRRGPLHGIPFALKDLYYVRRIRNTSGTKILETFVPDFDSTVALKLQEAGAVLLGKLNMHPMAFGATGENPDYGAMHNPWNPELITGGSSGGSGSAVAAGQCPLAMGSDTGGSIRIPGSLCGIVGLKPTYGRLSRYGIVPLAWSQDHAGPMARTVEDCALILNAVGGYDPKDPTSLNASTPNYASSLTGKVKGLRVGIIKEFFESPMDSEVREIVLKAVGMLRELGVKVSEVSWPMYRYAMPIASTIQMVEAIACHRELVRVHGHRLDPTVRLRLESGLFISAADYVQAERARTVFYHQSLNLFKKVDLLAGPTAPVTAFKIGTTEKRVGDQVMNVIPLLTQFTRPFNLNGFPAMTVPCGFSSEGLPVGLQLAGRPCDEGTVLRVAHAYEQAAEWHRRRPSL